MKDYINKPIIDFTFGIHPVAMSIAYMLGDFYYDIAGEHPDVFEPEFVDNFRNSIEFKTSPFYNGRERGICITMNTFSSYDKTLHVVFGECRSSDSIFVDKWVGKMTFNNPTVEDFSEEAYNNRKYFNYNQGFNASQHIQELLKDHVIHLLFEEHKELKQKKKKLRKKRK